MAQFRDPGSRSLQELISSYNEEIMRYSRKAEEDEAAQEQYTDGSLPPENSVVPQPDSDLTGRLTPDERQEQAEFEAESVSTERRYIEEGGKYALLRSENQESDHREAEARTSEAAEREQWLADLRQGLLELKLGLAALAQGQRELKEGLLEYKKGIAERDGRTEALRQTGWENDAERAPFFAAYHDSETDTGGAFRNGRDFCRAGACADTDIGSSDDPVPRYLPDTPPAQSPESIPSDGTGSGTLQTAVFTARQALPIAGALVRVFADSPQGRTLFASEKTDIDGRTPPIVLPVGTSSFPDPGYASPFVNYRVSVSADGYYPRNDLTAQIFNGVGALLTVELTPLPDVRRRSPLG